MQNKLICLANFFTLKMIDAHRARFQCHIAITLNESILPSKADGDNVLTDLCLFTSLFVVQNYFGSDEWIFVEFEG